jgi:predicted DNA-binding ribbon-helix-helix protein
MICKQCKNDAHLICGLNLNCSCCQKTLREIWQDDQSTFKMLITKLKEKQNVKAKTQNFNQKPRQEKN